MIVVLDLAKVPQGIGMSVQATEKIRIAIFRDGDRVTAIDDRCPHAGASLAQGGFNGTIVKCPLHGFCVDVWTGLGNGGKRVRIFPVRVSQNQVEVTVE